MSKPESTNIDFAILTLVIAANPLEEIELSVGIVQAELYPSGLGLRWIWKHLVQDHFHSIVDDTECTGTLVEVCDDVESWDSRVGEKSPYL